VAQEYFDRRKHARIEVVKAIFIEVVRRGTRSEAQNTILRCETVDISIGGLKIYVTQQIPQGSRLNIAVPLEDWKQNLELIGQCVWVRPAGDGKGFWVGLELHDSDRDSMEKWFKVVHGLSNTPPV